MNLEQIHLPGEEPHHEAAKPEGEEKEAEFKAGTVFAALGDKADNKALGKASKVANAPQVIIHAVQAAEQILHDPSKALNAAKGVLDDPLKNGLDAKETFDQVREVTGGLGKNNIMTSLQKQVGDALKIDDIDKPQVPTTPEPPTPETFLEAETHDAAVSEPLAITHEAHTAALEVPAAAVSDVADADPALPHVAEADTSHAVTGPVVKDAKAS